MQRIDQPTSRLRAFALATPARLFATCLIGGVAFGASTVLALNQFGISIISSGDQDYLSIPTGEAGERALLPVGPGEGPYLKQRLETGSRVLHSTDEGDDERAVSNPPTRAPRKFKVESSTGTQGPGMLIQTPDGRQVRVRPVEGDAE